MYDYKKMFIVGAVVFAIVFTFVQLFILSSQVAEHHAYNANQFDKIASRLEVAV